MSDVLSLRLRHGANLDDRDRRLLARLAAVSDLVPARSLLIDRGTSPETTKFLVDGVAIRSKVMEDGRRAIVATMLPGDFCDLYVAVLGRMDHAIDTVTDCRIVELDPAELTEIRDEYPNVARALLWASLVDSSVLREWLAGVGRRQSNRQMAHFFCEMLVRLQVVDRARGNSFEMPFTQEQLGDILGITTVHANRVLQELRMGGHITLQGGLLTIADSVALRAYAGFDADYLHLGASGMEWQG